MSIVACVNKSEAEPWCVPGLIQYETQYLILDRCSLVVSEPLSDCLEGLAQICSLSVIDHFEGLSEAKRAFERRYEYPANLEFARSLPRPYNQAKIVQIRDHCGEGV